MDKCLRCSTEIAQFIPAEQGCCNFRFWFNFSVENVHVDQRIIFNIANLRNENWLDLSWTINFLQRSSPPIILQPSCNHLATILQPTSTVLQQSFNYSPTIPSTILLPSSPILPPSSKSPTVLYPSANHSPTILQPPQPSHSSLSTILQPSLQLS